MEPLKNQFFNQSIFEKLTLLLSKRHKGLNQQKMLSELLLDLEQFELKERLRNTTNLIHKHLNIPYKQQIDILWHVAPEFKGNFFGMVFPDFVEVYGLKDLEISYHALEHFTQYSSSEFAIRPFFKLDFMQTLDKMKKWSKSDNFHVRRLSSEGARPRLPWSFQLKEVIEDPLLTLPILKNLKKDEEIYVKKSVANHLNDFSKDNPGFLTSELKNWKQDNPHTKWIINHGLRTLIKNGDEKALSIIGVSSKVLVQLNNLLLSKKTIELGNQLTFSFQLSSKANISQRLVVDFAIHYMKNNGTTSPKVFKLKTFDLEVGETFQIEKKIKFENYSTRKHYSGIHHVEIFINGKSFGKESFHLLT